MTTTTRARSSTPTTTSTRRTTRSPATCPRRCARAVSSGSSSRADAATRSSAARSTASGNPTFDPISKPGVLREYFSGQPARPDQRRADPLLARTDAARVHGSRRAHRAHRRAGPRRRLALPDAGRPLRGAAQERRGRRCAPPSAPSTGGSTRTGGSPTKAASSPRPTSRWPTSTGPASSSNGRSSATPACS